MIKVTEKITDTNVPTVLTLYERGNGKTAKHGLVFEATSVGGVSYLPVQIWQYHRQHKFIAECGATRKLRLPCYAHLPAAAFLYLIPKGSVRALDDGAFLELTPRFFDDVYAKLARQKVKITAAVGTLLAVRKKKSVDIEDGGDDEET